MSDGWPPITQPDLLAHLARTQEELVAFLDEVIGSLGVREFTEEDYRYGLAYPWERSLGSFALDGDDVRALEVVPADPGEGGTRYPLLAFGANGAPERLRLKLSALPGEDRRVVAIVGELHDFDVVASCHPTMYGAMPATLARSPRTKVTATLLWVSIAQLTVIAATEFTYHLGRLDPVRFESPLPGMEPVTALYAFVGRLGAFAADGGGPYALEAIPARDRSFEALSQEELMTRVARLGYGPDETARDLVRRITADFPAVTERLRPLVFPTAVPFSAPEWRVFPAGVPG